MKEYRDCRLVLMAVGLALLVAGIACASLGPIEVYVFYLFSGGIVFIVLLAASYLVVPCLGLRFYQGRNVRATFEAHDAGPSAIEARPTPVLVICLLDLFFLVALHALLLFGGLFPAFGTLLGGLEGVYLIDAAVLLLGLLLWGTWQQHAWAWWGSVVYYALLAATWIVTFAQTSYAELLAWLRLPPTELEALSGIPLRGYELGLFVGLPMLACLGLILASRRHFLGRSHMLPAPHGL